MKINPYKIRLTVAAIIGIFSVLAVSGLFYPIKFLNIQFTPLLQRLITDFSVAAAVFFGAIILLTLLFGRFYCSVICPLGILQEFGAKLLHRFGKGYFPNKWGREKFDNLPFRYLIAGLMFGGLIGGSAFFVRYIDPYTVFSSAVSMGIFGIAAVLVILTLVFFKNRFFCTNICPVGAVLGFISKFSANKIYIDENCIKCGICAGNCPAYCINPSADTIPLTGAKEPFSADNETCIKCLKCLSVCPKKAVHYGIQPVKFNPERRDFLWGMGALAMLGAGYAAGLNFAKNITQKVKDIILPAGAEDADRMANTCFNCNICVNNCPKGILAKADKNVPFVHIDYEKGEHYCGYKCHKCSEVCPSGAIKKISLKEKQNTKIGTASVSERCFGCEICAHLCPTGAISIAERKAVIDESKCIGCGKCAAVCKAGAINISGVTKQSKI